jgi:hypothetical protein
MQYGGGRPPLLLGEKQRGQLFCLKKGVFSDLALAKRDAAENCGFFGKPVYFAHQYTLTSVMVTVCLQSNLFVKKEL